MHYRHTYNIEDLHRAARQRLPRMCFDWLEGGAEDHVTWLRNREIFEQYRFRPHVMVDVGGRSQQVGLFGKTFEAPFGLAPVGAAGLYSHRADVALARAARDAGIPFVLSTASFDPLEEVAKAAEGGTLWFQLYMSKNRETAGKLVRRAFDAGFEALVVTGDVAVIGNREYNKHNRFSVPFRMNMPTVVDGLLHPRWLFGVFLKTLMHSGVPRYHNDESPPGSQAVTKESVASFQARRDEIDWADVQWLRDRWPRKLFVKGVLRADDALAAQRHGADGVFVSNHGGRALDGAVSSLEVLAEIRAAVGPAMKVMIDSGFRRGTDVVKALALGADMVFVGRATLYGLAAGGEPGVRHAIALLRSEIDRTLAQLGCRSIADIAPDMLRGA
ncbi:(S)-mandelate dehydrogenase [Variovorax sp. SRS16]|uniref:alpha-hydroxy acid oxidase n=1 Tax=Variovorax sp. SRS16 TaxID=282217 RepID=UPI001318BA3A|nr:alpha-hydroxy acid oxidase [Variovorax sp. SRS16]VTU15823.1 (S)-mandelate dehydrogenase [Variovorax sp. SRS16]